VARSTQERAAAPVTPIGQFRNFSYIPKSSNSTIPGFKGMPKINWFAKAWLQRKALGVYWGVALAGLAAIDGLIYGYQWGHHGNRHLHWFLLLLVPIVLALLYYVVKEALSRNQGIVWFGRLNTPRWTHLEPFFKKSRIPVHIVVLSYALFYVTQGRDQQADWALWINEHVFHFVLFCKSFHAIDVMKIEIAGYVLYLILQGIYRYRCPQILAQSVRKEGGVFREDTAQVFVDTLIRHGDKISAHDLDATLTDFANENIGALDLEAKALLPRRLAQLTRSTKEPGDRGSKDAAADAAGVARLFPSSLSVQIYYVGRDLFDILYPVTRTFLAVAVVVALATTSLPVVAKLVWVMFPRLGETCMADVHNPPLGFRDSDWVEFTGKLESQTATEVILIPADDEYERWYLAPTDVTEILANGDKRYFLRRGGTVRNIKNQGNNLPPPIGAPARMSFKCGSAGSRCANHIQICCDSGQIVGNCYGRWSCPNTQP
jgi:hypothetical protein